MFALDNVKMCDILSTNIVGIVKLTCMRHETKMCIIIICPIQMHLHEIKDTG